MTFRTNQPGSALASLSAFWEQSMQNRAMDLRRIPLWTARLFLFLFLCWHSTSSTLLFPSAHSTQIAPVAPASASIRRRQPLPPQPQHGGIYLNPHKNQSKLSPDRYIMMLNRDRDRERGLPLCWLFETKALIGMVLIPMFLLVSFGFESLPLPVSYSSFESRHPGFFFVCRGKCPTFLH